MSLFPESLPHHDCYLSRIDSRVRLLLGFLTIVTLLIVHNPLNLVLLFTLIMGGGISVSPPKKWLIARLNLAFFSLLPFVIVIPFVSQKGQADWTWGYLEFRIQGLWDACYLLLRTLGILLVVLTLLVAGPLHEYLEAARRLGLPNLFARLLAFTYRYTFLLVEELGRLRISLRVRGFRNQMNRHAYQTISHAAGTLIVRSAHRAEMVSHAMQTRGFQGRFRALPTKPWRGIDHIFFWGGGIFLLCLIAWDIVLRLN
jgi:cobalt/nickel transport system permease protein